MLQPVSRFLRQLETLLADVEDELGETLLSYAPDDSLGVHLSQSEEEDRSALLIIVVPASGEIILYHGRLLQIYPHQQEASNKIQQTVT